MRLFKIDSEDKFVEFKEQAFRNEHNESVLESWLENNPNSIIEDGRLLFIGRQVSTNLGKSIDLLALDRSGNTVILELKRDKTPRDTIAQALEYAAYIANLEYERLEELLRKDSENESLSLSDKHRDYFQLGSDEGVSFNKEQRIVIVGYDVTPEIRQTAVFLRNKGIRVTCIEFEYFQTDSGERLMGCDIVVGRDPITKGPITSGSAPKIDEKRFLEDCDSNGAPLFEAILTVAKQNSLPIHWNSKGFSLNADVGGTHLALLYAFPLTSAFPQTLYTNFAGIGKKIKDAPAIIERFKNRLSETSLFISAVNEMKFKIQQKISNEQIGKITGAFLELAKEIGKHGPLETE